MLWKKGDSTWIRKELAPLPEPFEDLCVGPLLPIYLQKWKRKTLEEKSAVQSHNEGDFLEELRRKKRREEDWQGKDQVVEDWAGWPGSVWRLAQERYVNSTAPAFFLQRGNIPIWSPGFSGDGRGEWRVVATVGPFVSTLGLLSFAYLWITGYSARWRAINYPFSQY